ncbi:hypothetical protein AB4212_00460, partial [Streptomyces sp. 2MCAF27]
VRVRHLGDVQGRSMTYAATAAGLEVEPREGAGASGDPSAQAPRNLRGRSRGERPAGRAKKSRDRLRRLRRLTAPPGESG